MNHSMLIVGLATSVFTLPASGSAGEATYPLKVSENGRYFVDQKGDPVFWMGTTQWQIFRDNTPGERPALGAMAGGALQGRAHDRLVDGS
jgi:Protein of unknown function (DUF4038)